MSLTDDSAIAAAAWKPLKRLSKHQEPDQKPDISIWFGAGHLYLGLTFGVAAKLECPPFHWSEARPCLNPHPPPSHAAGAIGLKKKGNIGRSVAGPAPMFPRAACCCMLLATGCSFLAA
jgi:hypothetical protein